MLLVDTQRSQNRPPLVATCTKGDRILPVAIVSEISLLVNFHTTCMEKNYFHSILFSHKTFQNILTH